MPVLFDHVALGLWKLADAPAVLAGGLGARPSHGGPGPGYRGGQWEFANGARIETLEPWGPPGGFLHRFLESRGSGIHHVTFKVPSLVEVCGRARSAGYDIVGYSDADPHWKEAFLHPRQALGIVVQFAEVKGEPEPGDGWQPGWIDVPEAGSRAVVEAIGLRMSVRSEARARRLWSGIAQGECLAHEEGSVFRWPGSPLRILVSVDSRAQEGPLWIEVASPAILPLPTEGFPALGTRFVQIQP